MDDAGRENVEELTLMAESPVGRRRRALWGALAAVGVAAGALVVVSAGEDGSTSPGLPVALGSAGDRGEGALAADAMLAWITYVAGDDLPALGGDAPAYRLTGAVDEAQVRALAAALGVGGELVHEGQTWAVSGDGGTLEVYEGAGAPWWYSSTTAGQTVPGQVGSAGAGGGSEAVDGCTQTSDDVVTDCVATTAPTDTSCTASDGPAECITGECPPEGPCALEPTPLDPPVTIECGVDGKLCPNDTISSVPPAPAADLPSEDEARAIAVDLLAATGVDVRGADVTAEGPFDVWYVTVEPRLDGVPSGLLAAVSVGPEGKVTNAVGYLGRAERLGDYPVLDTRGTIARANAQQGDGVAPRDGGTVATAAGSDAAVEQPPAECEACEPIDDAPISTVVDCLEGDVDCGSGGVVADPTTIPPCKVQPDGSEICEPVEPGITCPQAVPPADEPLGAPESIECTPPPPDPGVVPVPLPEPELLEVVLVDAEPSLLLLPAIDGSTDAYLVPAYRFTDADGGHVDLAAVADESLTGSPNTDPPSTDTTVPDTVEPPTTDGGGDPQPCGDAIVGEDTPDTTITLPPGPDCTEPGPEAVVLGEGEEPQIGVGYYVDVDVLLHCNWISVEFAGRWWWADGIPTGELERWSQPTEGGTLTLFEEDRAEFVGDAERTKVAELVPYRGTEPDRPLCA